MRSLELGLGCLPFPLLAASSRMRVTRAVSWTKSPVTRVPSPAITEPAARAKRKASDSPLDHAKYGVVDPLDEKASGLTGRGKRVTLRDANGGILADFILGKPVEGKPGYRYGRVPGQKRTYAVKTDADPSARFADWVNAGLLRIASASIRKVTVNRYNIDPGAGRMSNQETTVLTQDKGEWNAAGERLNLPAVHAMAAALDGLKIVDVRPKPPDRKISEKRKNVM